MSTKSNKVPDEVVEAIAAVKKAETENYFTLLNSINVNDKIETKNGLKYLSWSFAWAELKKRFPDATYTIYENAQGWNYHTDGRTCWVKTGVTVNGIEHIEYLPVMDYKNKSIPLENVTSYEINKSIQRSLTKAVARHGVGLYVYAGEDIPSESDGAQAPKKAAPKKAAPVQKTEPEDEGPVEIVGEDGKTYRQMLREFLQARKIDPAGIVYACHLTPKSTPAEWEAAYNHALEIYGGNK